MVVLADICRRGLNVQNFYLCASLCDIPNLISFAQYLREDANFFLNLSREGGGGKGPAINNKKLWELYFLLCSCAI